MKGLAVKKDGITKIVTLVFVLVFGVSLFMVVKQQFDYHKGDTTYSEAQEIAGLSSQTAETGEEEENSEELWEETVDEKEGVVRKYKDPYAAALAGTDLAALREVNEDVLGWITIPDTELSYPIVQAADNDYYLNRTWKEESSSVGSIFLECKVRPDFSDFNTIVYGHRMENGSMFGSLKYYKDIKYWEKHPSIYIVNDEGVHRYDIFAAYEAEVEALTFGLSISSRPQKQEFIELSMERTVIDTGIRPSTLDHILTLSTCTGRGYSTRWVVQAVLNDEAIYETD